MESKELIYRTLNFEQVPRVPYTIDFTVPARQRLLSDNVGRALYERIDNDMLLSPVIRVEWGVREPSGRYTDEFGLVWDRSIDADIGLPQPFITPENLDEYRWPDPTESGRFTRLKKNIKDHPDKFQVLLLDFSLYERAWGMRGMENFLIDLLEQQDFAEALLDKILAFNLGLIEAGLEACPGVDAVHFSDDFGSQGGILMGAPIWRKLIKPRLAQQYSAARSAGKKVCIHSCGKIEEILDDLVEIGVDIFNPFQPEVMDVSQLLRRYRGRLTFWGGISTQKLLPYAKVEAVEQRVEELLNLGRNGGYIIAPAHATPGDAKLENMAAMLQKIILQPQLE